MGNQSFFDMLGVKDLKELHDSYENDFSFFKDFESIDTNHNMQDIEGWLQKEDTSDHPFEADIYSHKHKETFRYSGRVTTLPDNNPPRYILSLNGISSHIQDSQGGNNKLEEEIFIQNNDSEQEEEQLKKFITELKELETLSSTLYYKGLPITYENKILAVGVDNVVISLSKKEFFIAKNEPFIYINIPIAGLIKTDIDAFNPRFSSVSLKNFRQSNDTPLRRKMLRVEMESDITVRIFDSKIKLNGVIIDINEQYIALNIANNENIVEGHSLTVSTSLSIDNKPHPFHTEVTVQRIQKLDDSYKLVVLCHLNNKNKDLFKKFISKRQMQILSELKESIDDEG